jgi:hypothetical protein
VSGGHNPRASWVGTSVPAQEVSFFGGAYMPVPKRYFHCSQEILSDPELWEFMREFGDRFILTWLQILIYLDRSSNQWRLTGDWLAVLSRSVRQSSANLSRQVGQLVAKGWLEVGEVAADGSPILLKSPNWLKYNRSPEHKRNGTNPGQGAVKDPLLSFPTPIPTPTPKDKEKRAVQVVQPSPSPFDDDWMASLRSKYDWLDVTREAVKCRTWCETNSKTYSRRRLVNWLNRIEKPLVSPTTSYRPTKVVL